MKKILVMASVMLLGVMGVQAAGTAANTSIDNNATLTYEVGGVTQTQEQSNVDTFVVDRRVDFVLTNDDGDQVPTTPGQVDVNTTWTLVNEGNADQNFTLASAELATATVVYASADTNDTEARDIWYSTDGGTIWTAYAAQIEIAADANITIRVASDFASLSYANNNVMNISLTATAVTAGGVTEASTAGPDTASSVDTVLAEAAGAGADGTYNAIFVAHGGYIIATAVIDVTKTSCVYQDPINGVHANAKRIPGATITYVLDINNTGTVDATSVSISDTLNVAALDYGSIANIRVDANEANCGCANGVQEVGGVVGANTGASPTVTIAAGTVTQSTHTCVSFEIDIQ